MNSSCLDVEPQGWTSLAASAVSQLLCPGSWGLGKDHYNPFPGLVDLVGGGSRLSVTLAGGAGGRQDIDLEVGKCNTAAHRLLGPRLHGPRDGAAALCTPGSVCPRSGLWTRVCNSFSNFQIMLKLARVCDEYTPCAQSLSHV